MGIVAEGRGRPLRSNVLAGWYRDHARPLLAETSSEALSGLDAAIARLAPGSVQTELRFCLVGDGGVGKSTLLNALLFDALPLLPRGGVGSVTARPISVRWGKDHALRLRYAREPLLHILASLSANDDAGASTARSHATLLIKGSQYAAVTSAQLIASIRACIRDEPAPSGLDSRDVERIERIRRSLRAVSSHEVELVISAGRDLPRFKQALDDHASGFLSPITSALEITWDSVALREGVVLVDLPGLGVAHDALRAATDTVLQQADALLLVVDRSGLTDTAVRALQGVGFFQRAVRNAESGAHSTELVIAITKLDLPASDLQEFADMTGGAGRHWSDHFMVCRDHAISTVRAQVREQLRSAARREGLPENIAAKVLAHAWVGAVAPHEHVRVLRRDPHAPARLVSLTAAGVTDLATALIARGARHRTDVARWLEHVLDDVARRAPADSQRSAARGLMEQLGRMLQAPTIQPGEIVQ